MPRPASTGPDRLSALWKSWRPAARRLALTARPALLPHLREADADQVLDVPHTLALSGFVVPEPAVAAAFGAAGTRAHEAGWPGPLPLRFTDPTAARRGCESAALAALDGWVAALVDCRLTVLEVLQGSPPSAILPAATARWREILTRPAVAAGLVPSARADGLRRHSLPGTPGPELIAACQERLWELADTEPAWDVRAFLLHLGLAWIRPWPGANGRVARLTQNTLRVAAGHSWLVVPATRADVYRHAVRAALDLGDAKPFAALVHSCTAHGSRPPHKN